MDGKNPIRKVPLFVTGNYDNSIINEIGGDREGRVANNKASSRHKMSFVMTQMRELQRQNNELKADIQTIQGRNFIIVVTHEHSSTQDS